MHALDVVYSNAPLNAATREKSMADGYIDERGHLSPSLSAYVITIRSLRTRQMHLASNLLLTPPLTYSEMCMPKGCTCLHFAVDSGSIRSSRSE